MARKLKTYETSLGFFDQAIAAPSMKAALEAWGTKTNLFHQGVAKEVDDPDVIAATMRKPGVILKRPIGSNGPFKEHADLPTDLPTTEVRKGRTAKRPAKREPPRKIDDKEARQAALAFEREQRQREAERQKEEAALAKQRERRDKAVAKAQAAIEDAKREHDKRASTIEAQRAAIDKKSQAEDARWQKQKQKLEIALRRARDSRG
jgi:colicin import membrane protein